MIEASYLSNQPLEQGTRSQQHLGTFVLVVPGRTELLKSMANIVH